ncbi:MAG: gamma-glutamyltransferase family protein [Hyphomicrobiales bacterium]|nr:gamma-glutamyltransferase family protein [Hyphomicrobiales bacterium]
MSNINPNPFTTRPEIDGTFGVCTSTHWIATAVGMSILERGGNAFDAAVATAFTLQVVEPHLNGPGGDVPVILHDTRKGRDRIEVICGQGPAPAGATLAHYRGLGLDLVPGTGLLACCVPGTFETWMLLLRDYGTLSLADVIEPAIYYAGEGHPLVERASFTIGTVAELFREHWPTSAAVYLPGGTVPPPGTLFVNKQLAETYARILREAKSVGGGRDREIEHARRMWSRGFVAEAIDRFCRTQEVMDSSGRRHRGVLTADDMARFEARIEAPLTYRYGRYTVCKAGFWSQGPAMLQQLALLKGFALDGADPTGADFIHTVVECSKLAYADRETYYGDPDFVSVPGAMLLSDAYNDARRKLLGEAASHEQRPGNIPGHGMRLEIRVPGGKRLAAPGAGEPTVGRAASAGPAWTHDDAVDPGRVALDGGTLERSGVMRGDTVHFDIIDRAGNMVSATPSGGWLQSSPTIPALGFCLGSRAQQFWLDEGHPNALAPGKRPRTTLTPTLALRDDEPYLAWGSPGGDQQDQWVTQLFLRHVHCAMNLQEAIDAPAWHSEHFPSSFWPREARPGVLVVEGRLPAETIKELRRRGHLVEVADDWSEGRLTAAARDGQRRKAAANPRGMQGYAAGR